MSDVPFLARISEQLEKHFNLDELQALCFDLGVDWEELAGDTKGAKARELVEFLQRRDRLEDLVETVRRTRPDVADETALLTTWPGGADRQHTLPSAPPGFTGRQNEIEDLLAHFAAGGSVALISGMGGVGKTSLALVVCARLAASYPDAGLIFECQPGWQPRPPEALLADVVHAFRPAAGVAGVPELQTLYRQALAGRRGLLMLDNAADAAQVRPFLPPPPGWAVLVTSRARFSLPGGLLKDLAVLGDEDAVAMLTRLLKDGGRDDLLAGPLDDLACLCGCLPLALRVAAGYLTTYPDWSLPDYLEALRHRPLDYLAVDGESVQKVLNLSYDDLRREDPALAAAWQSLAVFTAPFDRAVAAAVLGAAAAEARATLSALVQRNLLEFDPAAGQYDWPDLMRDCALAAPEPAGGWLPLWLRHADYYLALARAADRAYQGGGPGVLAGLAAFDAIRPHLATAWNRLAGRDEPEAQRWLSGNQGSIMHLLELRLTPRQLVPMFEAALTAARRLGDRAAEAVALDNLGGAHWALGDLRQTEACYEQQLAIAREAGDHRGEGLALANLGQAYACLGDIRRAIAYHLKALSIAREVGDQAGAPREEILCLNGLGDAYSDLGDPRRAIEQYEPALALARETGDRWGEAICLNDLGAACAGLGDPQRAVAYHQQALAIAREIGDRQEEGACLRNLSRAYAKLDDAPQAIAKGEQALAIARALGNRRAEAAALGCLGGAHALGNDPQAAEYYEQDLAIAREIGDRPEEARAAWLLGQTRAAQGDYPRAAELMQVLVDYENEIGHAEAEKRAADLEEVKRRTDKP